MYEFKEDDWKVFRNKIPVWQERFMTSMIDEYTRLMMGGGKGSDKFWKLKEKIDGDAKKKGVVIEMRRSMMVNDIIALFKEGTIAEKDLDGFSDGLKETVISVVNDEDDINIILRSIDKLSTISFDPLDYLDEAPQGILMTRFYDFIQKKIDKKIKQICKAIDESSEGEERLGLYRRLWDATDGFQSPHDEWSKDTISVEGDVDFWDESEEEADDRTDE